MSYELGIIGGGNMAEAIVRGAIAAKVLAGSEVIVSDPAQSRRELMAGQGCAVTSDNGMVIASTRRLLLAVKPQMFAQLAPVLGGVAAGSVVISIMAGVRLAKIASMCGPGAAVIRVMPNTPLLVGFGMSAISFDQSVSPADQSWCNRLFEAAGRIVHVDESKMDAVTAVSGSGPAYVFYLAEAMTQAGIDLGLSADQAALLAEQTILGAGQMMRKTQVGPAELRARVTSPNGTTQAAIESMDRQQVRKLIEQAVAAAARRSEELGRG